MKYTLILTMLVIQTSFGQSVKDELMKINQVYQKKSELFMKIEYKVYQGDSKTPIEIQKGEIAKTPSSLYQKLDDTETFSQDSLQVVVKHDRKMMILTPRATYSNDLLSFGQNLEKTLSKCSKITEVNAKGLKGYEMFVEQDGYTKIYFTYAPGDYMLHQVIFFYKNMEVSGQNLENVRLEMDYKYVQSDKIKRNLFDFVKRVNGRYESVDRFKAYQFMDYTLITGKVKTDSIK